MTTLAAIDPDDIPTSGQDFRLIVGTVVTTGDPRPRLGTGVIAGFTPSAVLVATPCDVHPVPFPTAALSPVRNRDRRTRVRRSMRAGPQCVGCGHQEGLTAVQLDGRLVWVDLGCRERQAMSCTAKMRHPNQMSAEQAALSLRRSTSMPERRRRVAGEVAVRAFAVRGPCLWCRGWHVDSRRR